MARITDTAGELNSLVPVVRRDDNGNLVVDYNSDDPFAGSAGVRGAGVQGLGTVNAQAKEMQAMLDQMQVAGFSFDPQFGKQILEDDKPGERC